MEKVQYKDLKNKLNVSEKTFVLISAEWCGQCKMAKLIIDKIKADFNDSITFIEIDVEGENLWKNNEIEISEVPTFLFYEGTTLHNSVSGYQYEETLTDLLKEFKNL